jgi:hypothetical protein
MMTNLPADSGRPRMDHDKIAARAAQLWRERGQPSGQDNEIWLEAERSLQAETLPARAELPKVDEAKPMPPGTAPIAAKADAPDAKPAPAKAASRKRGARGAR